MGISGIIQEGLNFVGGLVADPLNLGLNIINELTGRSLSKTPINVKVDINDITKRLTGRKLFYNIASSDELRDPVKAQQLFRETVNKNDKENLDVIFDMGLQNPKVGATLIQAAISDLYNRWDAVLKGKSKPEDGVVMVRLLGKLSEVVETHPEYKPLLSDVFAITYALNNKDILTKYPQFQTLKAYIDKYTTLNNILNIVDIVSVGGFVAGAVGRRVLREPLFKASAQILETVSAATPIATGVIRADINKESVMSNISPLDVWATYDAVKGLRLFNETKTSIATYDALNLLKSDNFDPSAYIIDNISKNSKLTVDELEELKKNIMMANSDAIKQSDTLSQTISKSVGDYSSFILNKIISTKNVEEDILRQQINFARAFFEYEPVANYFKKHMKDGKIVIDDVNKVEEDLFKMSKMDKVVENFFKFQRTNKLISELNKAVEYGNTEILIGNNVFSLKTPLKTIIDEAEKTFENGDILILTYKNKRDEPITRAIKPVYNPTNDEFRILKGEFKVLKDGEWRIEEKTFTIPLSRTHDIRNALKDYAKARGYDDIEVLEGVKYIVPASDIFPYKLERIADRLLKAEEMLTKVRDKVIGRELKEYHKLVKEAYDKGYLSKELSLEDYLNNSNYKSVLKEIKENIITHAKSIIAKNKEVGNMNKEYIISEGSSFLKMLQNELKNLEEIAKNPELAKDLYASAKGYIELGKEVYADVREIQKQINQDIKNLKDLLSKFTTAEKVGLDSLGRLSDRIDKTAKYMETTAEMLIKLAHTPVQDRKREGMGFATEFDSYEAFKNYATLKYLAPTFAQMKAVSFLNKLLEELDTIEKRNPNGLNATQSLVKKFLEMTLHKNETPLTKAQKILGNLITLLNPSIALGNFVAGLQSLHLLFPSLQIAKIGEIKNVWNKEFKRMLYSEGLYKYNVLNPFYVGVEAILKSHVLANLKNDEIFEKVIFDYAKIHGIKDEKVLESIKAYYNDRREEFAEDIVHYISGLDVRALQTFAINFGKIGENIMPWYRFIFTPFSIATQTLKNWKDAPEYIQRHGIGKVFGKSLAFSTFSAIALGSQAVPFMAPLETTYTTVGTLLNTLAVLFGEDEIFTDKNFAELVLKELDYNVLRTGLFDPNERVNFYTSFGSALLQAIAGAEASGWDTNPFIHAFRVGLDLVSKIGASGVISPTAGSYVADIPTPAFSILQNIVKKTLFSTDEQSKTTQTILALMQSIPITNNIYKEIAGKTLVKNVGAEGKDDIWQPSLPAELLSKEGQGIVGVLHLIGFIGLNADAILNGGIIQKAIDLFRYELATDEEKKNMFSPVRRPEGTDYYKLLNFRDYSVFYKLSPDDIIATLKYIPENELEKVRVRSENLITKDLIKLKDSLKKENFTSTEVDELKNRFVALQNFLIVADYMDWDSDILPTLKSLNNMLYKILKEKGIDVDYKDIIRVKRKLMENNKVDS